MTYAPRRLPDDLGRLIDEGIAGVRAELARYRDPASTPKHRKAQRAGGPEAKPAAPTPRRHRFEVIQGGKPQA